MRSLLLFAAYFGSVIAQAGVSTITTTILSTTSSVVSTSTSTLTASSCSTTTGSNGLPTATCKNSYVMSPVEVYSQAVITVTSLAVLTIGTPVSSSSSAVEVVQTQTQSQAAQTTPVATPIVAGTTSYVYSAASVSSTGITSSETIGTGSTASSTKHTTASTTTGFVNAASSSANSQSQSSSGTSAGTIAAIVIAVFLGLGLVGAAVFFYKRRQRNSTKVASGVPRIVVDAEKGMSLSLDRANGVLPSKTSVCSETTGLTASGPPTPSTPRDGFGDDVHERYEMNTPPPTRVYNMDARPSYSPFPRSASRKQ